MTPIIRKLFLIALVVCGALTARCGTWSATDLEQPRQYDADNRVSNPDGILSPGTVATVNDLLKDIYRQTGVQAVVAVIDDFDGGDIDDFATDLFMNWGVGERKGNTGILLVIAKTPQRYAFRTGRGIGSVVTDVSTARIARDTMVPLLKAKDYDGAVTATATELHSMLTTPEAKAEIERIKQKGVSPDDEQTVWDVILFYLWCSIALTVALAVWALVRVRATSNVERHARYVKLHPMLRIIFGLSFVGLGVPFLVYFPLKLFLKNLRDGQHLCPNCGSEMHKLDEITDNTRLTPGQDAEERFDSVDYDVWECPTCGEEDIYAFVNPDSDLQECPLCHARTARYVRDRVVKAPTTASEGLAVKEFECLNCRRRSQKSYKIPRLAAGTTAAAAAIPFVLGGMRGGGFGGGFGGGAGLGGGVTGGGGSSGGW